MIKYISIWAIDRAQIDTNTQGQSDFIKIKQL